MLVTLTKLSLISVWPGFHSSGQLIAPAVICTCESVGSISKMRQVTKRPVKIVLFLKKEELCKKSI